MTPRTGQLTARPWRTAAWIFVATLLAGTLFSCASSRQSYSGPPSGHFDGQRFHIDHQKTKSLGEVLAWQFNRESGGPWVRDMDAVQSALPPRRVEDDELRVTFVNHATVLIQTAGVNLLTDPIWSQRASPVSWAGPERYRPPGIGLSQLPPIDAVLISHNHYDHMDLETVSALQRQHDPLFIVPLGNCLYLDMGDSPRCHELDWWQGFDLDSDVRISAAPVQHWSRRGLFDANKALWAGYMIDTESHRVFFAGDTGWGEHFAEIRERLGAPDLAILPIGAYLPRWFMAFQHINPEEAVQAHIELGARRSMAIHFGTFRLADDGQQQPVDELRSSLAAAGLGDDSFWIPHNGEQRDAKQLGLQTHPAAAENRSLPAGALADASLMPQAE
ncbi:MAG: MBL fold metallo-hydrolase [Gammaproteobacteria bacterium]